jgi:tRNA(Ile)-lysidine synthase TilS/MesJ
VVQTNIAQIVFDARKETNPCALCAKLRKGALFTEITRQGINKCVFAHHREDCLESFLMSLLYEGRLRTFTPVTYLERTGVTLIRPLILLPEKEIKAAVRRHDIPVAKNPCPASGQTKREETKRLLAQISANNPYARERMLTAIHNTANYSLWD